MTPSETRIGFVGLGRMGANLARRLNDLGYAITALYDVYKPSAEALASELGAPSVETLAEVTEAADIIFTVVTDDSAMRGIFIGEGDTLLSGSAKGKIFLNCATVSPGTHQVVEAAAQAAGAHSLEACMASSIPQARNGTLYLMIGGDKAIFDQVHPLLDQISKDLTYVGTMGRAAQVKALVNMVMNINTAALAEGLGLGQALGLDLDMLRTVFSQTGANSRVLETDAEDMVKRDHDCFFSAAHAAKDSGIALGLAQEQGLKLPLAEATKQQYDLLVKLGLGELDKSGIAELTFPGRTLSEQTK